MTAGRGGRDKFQLYQQVSQLWKIFFPLLELWNFDKKRQDDCEISTWKQGSKKVEKPESCIVG